MAKRKPRPASPQSSSGAEQPDQTPTQSADAVERLTIDQAFQRLLLHFKTPYRACEHLNQAIRNQEARLWEREETGQWYEITPTFFNHHYLVSAYQHPGGWHAKLEMQAGKIGVTDFYKKERAIPAEDIDALFDDASSPGAKRGPKGYDTWELFKVRFFLDLDNDDVPANASLALINVEERAARLMLWGQNHRKIGEKKTPRETQMKAKVKEWWRLWSLVNEPVPRG
jgi:hypothetical protein